MTTFYLISGTAAVAGLIALWKPNLWSLFAAFALNAFAAWFILSTYLGN